MLAVNNSAGYALDTLDSEGAAVERQLAKNASPKSGFQDGFPDIHSPMNPRSTDSSFNFASRREQVSLSNDFAHNKSTAVSGARKANASVVENSLTLKSRKQLADDNDAELDELLGDLPEVGEDDLFFGDDSPLSTPRLK